MPLALRRPAVGNATPDYALIAGALALTRRDLLPDRWHKGASAVDAEGRESEPNDCSSVAWCVQGILLRHVLAGSNATIRAAIQLLHATADRLSAGRHETLFAFNDDAATTLADIERLLDAARAEAESLADSQPSGSMPGHPPNLESDQGEEGRWHLS